MSLHEINIDKIGVNIHMYSIVSWLFLKPNFINSQD